MARNHPYLRASFPLLLAFSLLGAALCCHGQETGKPNMKQLFKGMFVFGTSVVDNGNNNHLNASKGKANYLPYGIDSPLGPTGRFTNGKNVADIMGSLLGLPLLPSFADTNSNSTNAPEIIHGVNYGSGGSGILDDTGSVSGGVISLNQQIKNFENVTFVELKALLQEGQNKPEELLDGYLFMVATGNNDFLLNYFPKDKSSRPILPHFVANLISIYATYLQRLYSMGARKFALLTVYPLGCSPMVKQIMNSKLCVPVPNEATQRFNTQLIMMVDELKQKLPGSQFIVVNTYTIISDIIKNPVARGFSNTTSACCELKVTLGTKIACKEGGTVCGERDKYVYFDGQHNTEAVNAVIANKAFSSNLTDEVYPFNLQRLASV